MNAWKTAITALGLLLFAACTHAQIKYDFDARAGYASFRTYDWMAAPSRSQEKLGKVENPIMERRVKGAIERDLNAKGFRLESVADPDFLVTYYPVFKERRFRTATHIGMGWGHRPWWGVHTGTVVSRQHAYTEGTIVVEIVDFKTRQLIWHGAAVGALTGIESPEDAEEAVNREVPRLLANFPPHR